MTDATGLIDALKRRDIVVLREWCCVQGLGDAQTESLLAAFTEVCQAAVLDDLTGVWNRRGLHQLLAGVTASVAVVWLDIENMKGWNSRIGHVATDKMLVSFAAFLQALPMVSEVARWGGDEFVVLLRGDGDMLATFLCEVPFPIPVHGAGECWEGGDVQALWDRLSRSAQEALYGK